MRRFAAMFALATLLFAGVPAHAATPDADALGAPAPSGAPQVPLAATDGPTASLADLDGDGVSDALQAKLASAAPHERFDVIVTFDGPGNAASAQAVVGPFQVKHAFRILRGFAAGMTAGQLRGLSRSPGIFRIQEDVQFNADLIEARADYGADRAQAVDGSFPGFDGSGIGICVIDTGIDETHEQFVGKVDGFCDATGGGCNIDFKTGAALDTATPYDDHGHGTHVSGIAAGQGGENAAKEHFRGVAPAARLYGAKVLNSGGFGSSSDVIRGIDWCVSQAGVQVLNLSLGAGPTDGNDPVSLAVDCAVKPGSNGSCNDIPGLTPKIVITSAGNAGPMHGTVGTPATAREVIAVGAMGSAAVWNQLPDRRGHLLIAFSSRGPTLDGRIKPDIVAPGTGVTSAFADTAGTGTTHGGYWILSGTSMASPYVAGTVALMVQAMMEADPTRSPGDPLTSADVQALKGALYVTAQDRGPPGQDIDWGWGAIDSFMAVATAANIPGDPTDFGRHQWLEATIDDFSDWDFNFFVGDISRPISVTVINGDAFYCFSGDSPCTDAGTVVSDIEAELYDFSGTLLDLSTCADDPSEGRDPTDTYCSAPSVQGEGRQETLFTEPPQIGWYRLRLYPWNGDAFDDAPQSTSGVDLVYGGDSEGDDPPAVLITGPNEGDTVSDSVTITADASDDIGVARVEFSMDGVKIGTDTNGADGWSIVWNTPPDDISAAHILTATATDTGDQTASHSVGVIVENADVSEIISPAPGSTLSGSSETFTWTANGNGVENYALWFGSSPGALDLGKSGVLPGTQTSYSMTGLPTDGSTIYVTFFFKLAGDPGYTPTGYQYTAFTGEVPPDPDPDPGTDPAIVSPAPGSILSGSSETFTWTANGNGVENYALWFGTSPGALDLGKSGVLPGTQTSYSMTGLPTDGSTIHVTFFFKLAGDPGYTPTGFQYTAASEPAPEPDPEPEPEPGTDPEIVSPAPGSILSGWSETFTWTANGNGVETYALWFGTSPRALDLGKSGVLPGTQTSYSMTGLPTDGSTIHVTFFFKLAGDSGFTPTGYQYTAASEPAPEPEPEPGTDPVIVGPAPGSTLSGSSETFTWNANGNGVENYALWFGSSPGALDLGKSGVLPGMQTSYTMTSLPLDGRTVHVRFYFKIGGAWSSGTDYQYMAAPAPG